MVYLYCFDNRNSKQPDGAGHAAELGYVFGNLKKPNAVDAKLSQQMSSYWVNFAKTGNPNGTGLPDWRPFTTSDSKLMLFGGTSKMAPMPDLTRMKAWDDYFAWRRKIEAKR